MAAYILATAALLLSFVAGVLLGINRPSGKRSAGAAAGITKAKLGSVTRSLMICTLRCALVWVFLSYGIAIYSTVQLGVVYTMAELSEPAIYALLGVNLTKVLENIFEHNDGKLFGVSNKKVWSESDHIGDL